METRTNRKLFLIVLLGLSVVLTGCSSQFYTALVSSEESPRLLASLSGSPSTSESLASQQSQSKTDDLLQGRETAQIVGSEQNSRDIFSTFSPGMKNEGGLSSQGEFGSMVPRDGVTEFLSSSSDDITPLDDQDLLTEMAAASGTGGSTGSEAEAFSSRQSGTTLAQLGDVFFDFDAVAIRSDAASTLHANAQILKARFDNLQVVIEGHCDERGTAEYNLVLGERRAQTTKQYLVDLGVSSAAIQTISYGKEKPFCTASQPDCWKMNRRGHFVVQ